MGADNFYYRAGVVIAVVLFILLLAIFSRKDSLTNIRFSPSSEIDQPKSGILSEIVNPGFWKRALLPNPAQCSEGQVGACYSTGKGAVCVCDVLGLNCRYDIKNCPSCEVSKGLDKGKCLAGW